jgi:hypothetical protein
MMESLKRDFVIPQQQNFASGETDWRCYRKGSQMTLTMPYPDWNEVTIDIGDRPVPVTELGADHARKPLVAIHPAAPLFLALQAVS